MFNKVMLKAELLKLVGDPAQEVYSGDLFDRGSAQVTLDGLGIYEGSKREEMEGDDPRIKEHAVIWFDRTE